MTRPSAHALGDTPPGHGTVGKPHPAASRLMPCEECGKYRPYKLMGPGYAVILFEVTGERHTHGG